MGSTSSTTSRELPESVTVGLVRRAHGIRGEVLVEVLSDVAGRFAAGQKVAARASDGASQSLTITGSRKQKADLIVQFAEVPDRDGAERLRGARLEVPRGEVPRAEAGTYYYFELVGCRCRDLEAGELGTVEAVLEDGGGVCLLVRGPGGEVPIPFVARFIRSIDIEAGWIELALPPGLLEMCRSQTT